MAINLKFEEAQRNMLTGNDLLKAMKLYKHYPTDSHFDDDVSMYGFSGILERLVGYCQQQACWASQNTEPDDMEKFEFYKQAALVLSKAVLKMNNIDVPESLSMDQPYGDGRL